MRKDEVAKLHIVMLMTVKTVMMCMEGYMRSLFLHQAKDTIFGEIIHKNFVTSQKKIQPAGTNSQCKRSLPYDKDLLT